MPDTKLTPMENPFKAEKWGVHVQGPDTILAAHSFEEAVQRCHEINETLIKEYVPITNGLMPMCWAVVGLWKDMGGTDEDHDPENTDWSNLD